MTTKALEELIERIDHNASWNYEIPPRMESFITYDAGFTTQATAELKAIVKRNTELEEYHGFYMGRPIPPGDEELSENGLLRAQLAQAQEAVDEMAVLLTQTRLFYKISDELKKDIDAVLEKYPAHQEVEG